MMAGSLSLGVIVQNQLWTETGWFAHWNIFTPWGIAEHRFAVVDGQLNYRIRVRLGEATELQDFLSGTYRRFSGH